ncbi:MAG: sulfatase-like hydrolase/transferase, partial [Acidobacteria bacterium]|nr:sulfatase-like hydrolase/transferase [Acidobacteriota bacterium]
CGDGSGARQAPAGEDTHPNIVLITLDTTRADHLGAYGGNRGVSPHLDRLAASGTVFTACDTASPLTLPAHATLLSGLYPPRHGLRANGRGRLDADLPILPQWLSQRGYQTGAFISSAVLDRRHGLDRGFDVYDDQMGSRAERRGDITVDRALAWWRERDERPAFLWVHLFDPHAPYRPPAPWAELFPGNPYDGELAFMDAQAGRLLAGLGAPGPETLVAVIGDHGEGLGEHGEKEHGLLLYQSTLAVPFILSGPGIPAGRRVTSPVRTIDLLPTLLAQAAIPAPGGLPGRDALAPATDNLESYAETLMPWDDYGWHPLHTLRRGGDKLIQGVYPSLYDLQDDPHETQDLLDHETGRVPPGIRARGREMGAALHTLQEEGGAATAAASRESPVQPLDRLRSLGYLAGAAGEPPAAANLLDPRGQTTFHRRVGEAMAAYRDADHEQAAAILGDLLRRQAHNPFLQDLAGSVAMARGRHNAAMALFSAALEHTPDRAPVEVHLAEALLASGRAAEAERRSRHALDNLPTPPPVRAALILCRSILRQERPVEAGRCAAQFLAIINDPSHPLLPELRGLAELSADRSSTP